MMGPVDADVVNVVLAIAQLDDAVDDPTRICSERCFRCLVSGCATDDRPRALAPVRWDLTDLVRRGRRTPLEGNHLGRRGRRSLSGVVGDDLAGLNGRVADRSEDEDALTVRDLADTADRAGRSAGSRSRARIRAVVRGVRPRAGCAICTCVGAAAPPVDVARSTDIPVKPHARTTPRSSPRLSSTEPAVGEARLGAERRQVNQPGLADAHTKDRSSRNRS